MKREQKRKRARPPAKQTKAKKRPKRKMVSIRLTDGAEIELPLIIEDFGGKPYEYVPLGKYIVAARNVCGGRPTIKYHRLDARWILAFYNNGDSMSLLAKDYKIPLAAVKEVIALASRYDYEKSYIKNVRRSYGQKNT